MNYRGSNYQQHGIHEPSVKGILRGTIISGKGKLEKKGKQKMKVETTPGDKGEKP
jgi:hypothetical protein